MDASTLAATMLEWEIAQNTADLIKQEIIKGVLEIKTTQVVGNVRATYSKGRKKYDYEGAIADIPITLELDLIIGRNTKTVTKVDWRAVCHAVKLREIPYIQAEPSVSVRLKKPEPEKTKDPGEAL